MSFLLPQHNYTVPLNYNFRRTGRADIFTYNSETEKEFREEVKETGRYTEEVTNKNNQLDIKVNLKGIVINNLENKFKRLVDTQRKSLTTTINWILGSI